MRALITGIRGFAARYLALHLQSMGDQILGTYRGQAESAVINDDLHEFPWDLRQPANAMQRRRVERFEPDCIFHLAALSIPADCGDSTPNTNAWQTNVEGTRHVLDLMDGLRTKPRLVFISSSQVYAAVDPDNPRVNEDAPLDPRNAYGQTKRAAEAAIEHRIGSLEAIIIRVFKHTGPGQSSRLMLPEWARQFASPIRPVRLRTRASHVDISDVRDIVRAYRLLALLAKPQLYYNVGGGVNYCTGDIFDRLRAIADPDAAWEETQPGFRQEAIADIRRCVTDVEWAAEIPLEKTIRDTWTYWRQRS